MASFFVIVAAVFDNVAVISCCVPSMGVFVLFLFSLPLQQPQITATRYEPSVITMRRGYAIISIIIINNEINASVRAKQIPDRIKIRTASRKIVAKFRRIL